MKNTLSLLFLMLIILLSCDEDNGVKSDNLDINSDTLLLVDFGNILTDTSKIVGFTDNNDNGSSTINISYHSTDTNDYMITSYKLDQGNYAYGPYAHVEYRPNGNDSTFDASEYEGVAYRYRGNSHTFQVIISEVTDWCDFEIQIPASDDWDTAIIIFKTDLMQPNWGQSIDFTSEHIKSFGWRVTGVTGDSGTFFIDDIKLLKSIIKEKNYDMEIKDAEIPELNTLSSDSITTPLNQKVIQYLSKGINLPNWLEEDVKFNGTYKYNRSTITQYANWGFKGIRLPIDLDKWVIEKDSVISGLKNFSMDPEIFGILDSFLLWTEINNISLTIDYHQYDGSLNIETVDDTGYIKMAANCWKSVASYCAQNSREDLFLELTNEPGISEAVPNDKWRIMAKVILDSIRTVDTVHSVIYGDSRWYEINVLTSQPLFAPDDGNIIYAFHYYEPFIYTHQAASWADMGTTHGITFPYNKDKWSTEYSDFGILETTENWIKNSFKEYYKTGNKNAMMNPIIDVKNWAKENNVAIICNEFGANPTQSDTASLVNYFTAIQEIFTELEIGWAVWFGIFDDDGNLLPGMKEALGL